MIDKSINPNFLNDFLDYYAVILNKSPNTLKEYNYDLTNFLRFIQHHFKLTTETDLCNVDIREMNLDTLKKIQLSDIHAYLAYLTQNNHAKPTTRARKVSSIKTFFNYLTAKTNILEINPAQNLETPKIGKRIPKYLTLEQSQQLLTSVSNEDNRNNERDYAIITLFLNCGMRLSELVGINIKDIDFSEQKLNVIGKGNKERTIYLNKSCIKVLQDYLRVRPHEGVKTDSKNALFLSERRERISNRTVQYVVKRELSKLNIDISKYSVHKLRHTAATLMYQYGNVDIRALQELLGHESIATTEIYTHVANEQVRSAVENNPLANFNE